MWNGSYVRLWFLRRGTLHNSPQHSEFAALCRLWLCAAAALDEANDTADNSKIGDRSFTRSGPNPIYIDRDQFSISSKIGTFSSSVCCMIHCLQNLWHRLSHEKCTDWILCEILTTYLHAPVINQWCGALRHCLQPRDRIFTASASVLTPDVLALASKFSRSRLICLGLLLPRSTNPREADFTSATYCIY